MEFRTTAGGSCAEQGCRCKALPIPSPDLVDDTSHVFLRHDKIIHKRPLAAASLRGDYFNDLSMKRKSNPKPIGSILESTLKSLDVDFQLKAYSIWGAWREIVGEAVADQTQPRSIRNRILFMDVSHPTWIQQLQFLKPKLLEKINAFFGEPLLQDIRFRMGKITPPLSPPAEDDRWQEEKLDEETMNRIDLLLQKVDDGEVKRSLRDVLIKGAQLERHRKKSK